MPVEDGLGFIRTKVIGASTEDDLGREYVRVSSVDERSIALLNGRIRICETSEQLLDSGDHVEIAIKGSALGPVALLEVQIAAQMEQVTFNIFEGGVGLAGGFAPVCINPNRINQKATNSTVLAGIPATPITGTDGTDILPGGWKIQGQDNGGSSDYVNTKINVNGFICIPDTWYQLRFTNTGPNDNRPIQVVVTYIDPEV